MLQKLLDEMHALEAKYHDLLDPEKTLNEKARELAKACGHTLTALAEQVGTELAALQKRMDAVENQTPTPAPAMEMTTEYAPSVIPVGTQTAVGGTIAAPDKAQADMLAETLPNTFVKTEEGAPSA